MKLFKNLRGVSLPAGCTAGTFCLLLFGIALLTLAKPDAFFSEVENRVLAQRPNFTPDAVLSGAFERNYEEYLADQFAGRDGWIAAKTALQRAVGRRECKGIYFAADDYLIERHAGVYDTDTARRSLTALAAFARRAVEQVGADHVSVLLIPNAVDILQGKLPPFAPPPAGPGYLAQAAAALPDGVWLDAAAVLQPHAGEPLYYRTDHHWKTRAAFYVYRAWAARQGFSVPSLGDYRIQTVSDRFEGTIQARLGIHTVTDTIELFLPLSETACTIQAGDTLREGVYDWTALQTKDQYAVFLGGNEPFVQITTPARTGRRLLILKDSYANCFVPFLLPEFEQIDLLDLRYTNRKVSEQIESGAYTDFLVLYNAAGFAGDSSAAKLAN